MKLYHHQYYNYDGKFYFANYLCLYLNGSAKLVDGSHKNEVDIPFLDDTTKIDNLIEKFQNKIINSVPILIHHEMEFYKLQFNNGKFKVYATLYKNRYNYQVCAKRHFEKIQFTWN